MSLLYTFRRFLRPFAFRLDERYQGWRQETIILLLSVWFMLTMNGAFWRAVLAGKTEINSGNLTYMACLGVAITAIHFLLLAILSHRLIAKPIWCLFLALGGFSAFYIQKFGIYIDPDMVRNVLRTDVAEAKELFTWDLARHVIIFVGIPCVLISLLPLRVLSFGQACLWRIGSCVLAILLLVGSLGMVFQDVSAQMRNHKETRYLLTPANATYSLIRALGKDVKAQVKAREAIGTDAALGGSWKNRNKPVLFVFVVGETARAANWGEYTDLQGKSRQTTPELAKRDLITFADVTSCGTNTEVSVPCLFSKQGRRNYDEDKIRSSESLLHVLKHAGFRVVWRDNQAGCKGVCSGLEEQRLHNAKHAKLCDGERCLDEILLDGAEQLASDNQGNLVLVLHQLGNHGPAYFRRYPEAFRRFTPTCDTQNLGQCTQEQIINSYDNALVYTDHFLAKTLDFLQGQSKKYDTALVYVSDHGESLGENNLFLHGMPYAIAPKEQTKVPMFMWFSPEYLRNFQLDQACLKRIAKSPVSHDNIFHSVLGLLDVRTKEKEENFDLSTTCRKSQVSTD